MEPAPLFPIRLADKGPRPYFVDQNNAPFFFHCDIVQGLLNRLKIEDVRFYLDTRKAQGFSAVWFIIASPNEWTGDTVSVPARPDNAYGERPFNNESGDLSSPDGAYFSYARQVADEAASRGMMAGIAPAYVGFNGGDMLPLMKKSGPAGCRAYGGYLGNFFGRCKNVFWIHQGDENAYNFGGQALVDAVVEGIKSADPVAPRFHTAITRAIPSQGVPAALSRSSSLEGRLDAEGREVNPMPWLNLNNVYLKNRGNYAGMLKGLRKAWKAGMPFVTLDGVTDHYYDDAAANRAQAYYALLSGACGFFTGNIRICWFMKGWKKEILNAQAEELSHISRLFKPLRWWTLIPEERNDLCAAALADDKSAGIYYIPSGTPVPAIPRAMWFNPRTGMKEKAGKLPPGDGDWVLVLHSTE